MEPCCNIGLINEEYFNNIFEKHEQSKCKNFDCYWFSKSMKTFFIYPSNEFIQFNQEDNQNFFYDRLCIFDSSYFLKKENHEAYLKTFFKIIFIDDCVFFKVIFQDYLKSMAEHYKPYSILGTHTKIELMNAGLQLFHNEYYLSTHVKYLIVHKQLFKKVVKIIKPKKIIYYYPKKEEEFHL